MPSKSFPKFISDIDVHVLILYKTLLMSDPEKSMSLFASIPLSKDELFGLGFSDFFYGNFDEILSMITPFKRVFLDHMENCFDGETGVDRYIICHPSIKKAGYIYDDLKDKGLLDSDIVKPFFSLYSMANDYIPDINQSFYFAECYSKLNKDGIWNRVCLYVHGPPYEGSFYFILYRFYLLVDALNKAIIYAKEVLGYGTGKRKKIGSQPSVV